MLEYKFYRIVIEVPKLRDCMLQLSIVLAFDRHIGSAAADIPVKFQSGWKRLNLNLVAWKLHEILQ